MTDSAASRSYRTARQALLVFLGVRLLLAGLTLRDPTGGVLLDSADYIGLAQGVLQTGRYVDLQGHQADLTRPPGYPALLVGLGVFAGEATWPITLVQLAISGAAAWLMLGIGSRLGRPRLGLVSGWLLALSPNLALWSLTVMSETLFAALLALAFFLWVRALGSARRLDFAWVGLALGGSALVRPIGLVLIPVWAVLTYWALRRRLPGSQALAMESAILVIGALVAIAWMGRNQLVYGSWTFTDVSSKTVIGFDLADVLARGEGITRSQAAEQLQSGSVVQQTLSVASAYPAAFARAQLLGLARTGAGTDIGTWGNVLDWDRWTGLGLLTGILGSTPAGDYSAAPQSAIEAIIRGGLLAASLLYGVGLMGLSLLGAILGWRESFPTRIALILALITAATVMLVPLAAGQARFRVPAEPFLAIVAAYALVRLVDGWRRRRSPEIAEGLNA